MRVPTTISAFEIFMGWSVRQIIASSQRKLHQKLLTRFQIQASDRVSNYTTY